MNEEKKLPDEAVEDVAGGTEDFDAFTHLNCTECYYGKHMLCYYPKFHRGQYQAFMEFGSKPDAVCLHKKVI